MMSENRKQVLVTGANENARYNKIQSIKAWRAATNAGLKEAKDAVEATYLGYTQTVSVTHEGLVQLNLQGFITQVVESEPPVSSTCPLDGAVRIFLKELIEINAINELHNFLNWYKLGGLTQTTNTRRLET